MAIFVWLCAALVSTLVGCLVAYVAIPVVELPAFWATRLGRDAADDPHAIEEEYVRRLETGSHALELLSAQTEAFRNIGDTLADGAAALKASLEGLTSLDAPFRNVSAAAEAMSAAATGAIEAAKSQTELATTTGVAMAECRKQTALTSEAVQEQKQSLTQQTRIVGDVLQELSSTAKSMDLLLMQPIERFVRTLSGILDTLLGQVQSLLGSQKDQAIELHKMVTAVETVAAAVGRGANQLESATEALQSRSRDIAKQQTRSRLATDRLVEVTRQLVMQTQRPPTAPSGAVQDNRNEHFDDLHSAGRLGRLLRLLRRR